MDLEWKKGANNDLDWDVNRKQGIRVLQLFCNSPHVYRYLSYLIGYDFKLTSLLVVDDYSQDLPVGWCLSNKEDFGTLKIFFEHLKISTGNINPAWCIHISFQLRTKDAVLYMACRQDLAGTAKEQDTWFWAGVTSLQAVTNCTWANRRVSPAFTNALWTSAQLWRNKAICWVFWYVLGTAHSKMGLLLSLRPGYKHKHVLWGLPPCI